jgi:3-hydroxyisobutyrate dehydrogenase-like beta-hydroxyacid dehydrogenase
MTDRIGVVGLGRMGLPIAVRLLQSGDSLAVFDVAREAAARAGASGAAVMDSARNVASGVDIVITVLPGPQEFEAACVGSDGILAAMNPGACLLDFTSNDPHSAGNVATEAAAAGIGFVGAPMGGGPGDAAAGTLRFYVGGEPRSVDRVRPVLDRLSAPGSIDVVGPDVAAGYTAKLLANTLWFGQAVAVTEVLLLGQQLGLDLVTLHRVLARSAGGSVFLTDHAPALLAGDYLTTFGLDRVVEELDAVTRLAAEAGAPAALMELVAALHREALAEFGPVDGELMVAKLLETRAGRTLRACHEPLG